MQTWKDQGFLLQNLLLLELKTKVSYEDYVYNRVLPDMMNYGYPVAL